MERLAADGYWPGSEAWGSPSGRLGSRQGSEKCRRRTATTRAAELLVSSLFPTDDDVRARVAPTLSGLATACGLVAAASREDGDGVLSWRGGGGESAIPLLLTALKTCASLPSDPQSLPTKVEALDAAAGALACLSRTANGGGDHDLSSVRLDIGFQGHGRKIVGVETLCCDTLQTALANSLNRVCVIPSGTVSLLRCTVKRGLGTRTGLRRDHRLLPLLSRVLQLYDIASLTRFKKIKLPLTKTIINGYARVTPYRKVLVRGMRTSVSASPHVRQIQRLRSESGGNDSKDKKGGDRGSDTHVPLDMKTIRSVVYLIHSALECDDDDAAHKKSVPSRASSFNHERATRDEKEGSKEGQPACIKLSSPKGNFGVLRPLLEILRHCHGDALVEEEESDDGDDNDPLGIRRHACALILRLASSNLAAARRVVNTPWALQDLTKAAAEFPLDESIAKHATGAMASFAVCEGMAQRERARSVFNRKLSISPLGACQPPVRGPDLSLFTNRQTEKQTVNQNLFRRIIKADDCPDQRCPSALKCRVINDSGFNAEEAVFSSEMKGKDERPRQATTKTAPASVRAHTISSAHRPSSAPTTRKRASGFGGDI